MQNQNDWKNSCPVHHDVRKRTSYRAEATWTGKDTDRHPYLPTRNAIRLKALAPKVSSRASSETTQPVHWTRYDVLTIVTLQYRTYEYVVDVLGDRGSAKEDATDQNKVKKQGRRVEDFVKIPSRIKCRCSKITRPESIDHILTNYQPHQSFALHTPSHSNTAYCKKRVT